MRLQAALSCGLFVRHLERRDRSYYIARATELEPTPGTIDAMRDLQARSVAQTCMSSRIVDANINALCIGKIIAFSLSLQEVSSGKRDPHSAKWLAGSARSRRRPSRSNTVGFFGI
jgi:hypothetical protein